MTDVPPPPPAPAPAPPVPAPVPAPPRRLDHVDVLRGIAMLGILPVNLPMYAFGQLGVRDAANATALDRALHGAVELVFRGNFITIFAFLFGAGLAFQRRSHEARAAAGAAPMTWAELMARRLGVLFAFGVAHAVLLWWGDIVSTYAMVGLAGAVVVTWSPRAAVWTGASLVAAYLLLCCGGAGLTLAASGAGSRAFTFGLVGDVAAEHRAYVEDGYLAACLHRGTLWLQGQFAVALLYSPRLLGLFALGAAAVRSGLLDDPLARRRTLTVVAVAGALLGAAIGVVGLVVAPSTDDGRKFVGEFFNEVASLPTAAAYASAILLWAARPDPGPLRRAFAAVGRAAFSNYVLQSVAMTFLLTGVGLGLHGRLTYAEALAWVLPIWALCAAFSVLWMRRFGQGPVERAWRRLAMLGVRDRGEGA